MKNLIKVIISITLFPFFSLMAKPVNIKNIDCDAIKKVNEGTLCALKPSKTGFGIQNFSKSGRGFGYHVIGIPKDGVKFRTKIHVHFGGTGGQSFKKGEFKSELFLREGMSHGRLMIQLAYDNEVTVESACRKRGQWVDNCAGLVRLEKISGENTSTFVQVNRFNGINYRHTNLVRYLKSKDIIPHSKSPEKWDNVLLSGHSEGAGQALYIAKYFGSKGVCLLAGGNDKRDNVYNWREKNLKVADWIAKSPQKTTNEKIKAVAHTKDKGFEKQNDLFKFLGLYRYRNVHLSFDKKMTDIYGRKINNGHKAAIKAVEMKGHRNRACFK